MALSSVIFPAVSDVIRYLINSENPASRASLAAKATATASASARATAAGSARATAALTGILTFVINLLLLKGGPVIGQPLVTRCF